MRTLHIKVLGRVQGVGFRYHTRGKALELGVKGWVRNLPEGTVEIWAEGEEASVEAFYEWCFKGPQLAKVTQVEVIRDESADGTFLFFDIR